MGEDAGKEEKKEDEVPQKTLQCAVSIFTCAVTDAGGRRRAAGAGARGHGLRATKDAGVCIGCCCCSA